MIPLDRRKGFRVSSGGRYYGWKLRDHLARPHFEGFPLRELYAIALAVVVYGGLIWLMRAL